MGLTCKHIACTGTHAPREIIEKTDLVRLFNSNARRVEERVPSVKRSTLRYFRAVADLLLASEVRTALQTGGSSGIGEMFIGLPTPDPVIPGYTGQLTKSADPRRSTETDPRRSTKTDPSRSWQIIRKTTDEMIAIEQAWGDALAKEVVAVAMGAGVEAWEALADQKINVVGSFTLENAYVGEMAKQRVGWLIQEVRLSIDEGLRDQVAEIIAGSDVAGYSQRQAARRIRDIVGLRPDQVNALANVEKRLIDQGLQGKKLADRMARESAKRLRYRADMIARTEMNRAVSSGRHAAWMEARDQGLFQGQKAYVEWVAGLTDRTCPICADLHGSREELGALFGSTEAIPQTQSVQGEYPPIHPMCRCTTILVFEEAATGR